MSFPDECLTQSVSGFRAYKELADRALAQVGDDALFEVSDEESNSLAVIMKHMAGNMRITWGKSSSWPGTPPAHDGHRSACPEDNRKPTTPRCGMSTASGRKDDHEQRRREDHLLDDEGQ